MAASRMGDLRAAAAGACAKSMACVACERPGLMRRRRFAGEGQALRSACVCNCACVGGGSDKHPSVFRHFWLSVTWECRQGRARQGKREGGIFVISFDGGCVNAIDRRTSTR